MFADLNVERSPFTIGTGPSIAPVNPSSFEPKLMADGLSVYIEGAADAGAIAKIVRPFLLAQSTGKFTRSITITPDEATQGYGGAIEFDIRITDANGYTYPLDMQILIATGELQLAIGVAAGNIAWANTGIVFGKLPPGQPSTVTLSLSVDTTAHNCSALTASCNGVSGSVPAALQNQPAFSQNWEAETSVYQYQRRTVARFQ